jgi:hypothetical protein
MGISPRKSNIYIYQAFDERSPELKKSSKGVNGSLIHAGSNADRPEVTPTQPKRTGIISDDLKFEMNKHKRPTTKEDNTNEKTTNLEESLAFLSKFKAASLAKQEEIITGSSVPNKKEVMNNFNMSKQKYVTKVSELKTLGFLGYRLEEMRLSIEKRYEFMLNDLNIKLESLKKYFNTLINEVKGEAFNSIVNEKEHNLSNIKEYLEDRLFKIKQGEENGSIDKDNNLDETSFKNFFDFFENFKEECFNMVVSKSSNLNTEHLKKQLFAFKGRNLESLLNAPKVFMSQLFRFFEGDGKLVESRKSEVKSYGDVLSVDQPDIENALFERNGQLYDPDLASKSKTPMIGVINHKYMIIVSREKFRIVSYSYTNNGYAVPKSKFYQNIHHEKGDKLCFQDVYSSNDLQKDGKDPGGAIELPFSLCSQDQ